MTDDTLTKRAKDADVLAWFVLVRRLFVEMARVREPGFLKEQAELAEQELRALNPPSTGKQVHPETLDMASDVIVKLLSGITINPAPDEPKL